MHPSSWKSDMILKTCLQFAATGLLQNHRLTEWVMSERDHSESSYPTSVLKQGLPTEHCTKLHPDSFWVCPGDISRRRFHVGVSSSSPLIAEFFNLFPKNRPTCETYLQQWLPAQGPTWQEHLLSKLLPRSTCRNSTASFK